MALIERILVPIDFSETARHAADLACTIAKAFRADLTLLHVYQIPSYVLPEGMVVAGSETMTDLMWRADSLLAKRRDELASLGVGRVSTTTAIGTPFVEIVRTARDGRFDLIVMGTHGRSGLAHAFLGSVAEKVVRKAPCPVLSVKDSAHRFELP